MLWIPFNFFPWTNTTSTCLKGFKKDSEILEVPQGQEFGILSFVIAEKKCLQISCIIVSHAKHVWWSNITDSVLHIQVYFGDAKMHPKHSNIKPSNSTAGRNLWDKPFYSPPEELKFSTYEKRDQGHNLVATAWPRI